MIEKVAETGSGHCPDVRLKRSDEGMPLYLKLNRIASCRRNAWHPAPISNRPHLSVSDLRKASIGLHFLIASCPGWYVLIPMTRVSGNLTILKASGVKNFLRELYSPEHAEIESVFGIQLVPLFPELITPPKVSLQFMASTRRTRIPTRKRPGRRTTKTCG
jgi:hypothetical protein